MNLIKMGEIIALNIDDVTKKKALLIVLAEDKSLVPDLLSLLEIERKGNNELIKDMNIELSRTQIYIEEYCKGDKKKGPQISMDFVLNRVGGFYERHENKVKNCFKR